MCPGASSWTRSVEGLMPQSDLMMLRGHVASITLDYEMLSVPEPPGLTLTMIALACLSMARRLRPRPPTAVTGDGSF